MVDKTSHMFITGPDVIKTVTGEDVEFEELGARARTHNSKSGVAHHMAPDEAEAIDFVKQLLGFLPSNNLDEPPSYEVDSDLAVTDEDLELDTLLPDSSNQPYDMHIVIEHILDDGDFLEIHPLFAPNILCGFGRVDGRSVGVVANQPTQMAGTLDIDASEKAARFVRTCDAFNIPVLTFVDVPGFLPGTDQEWNGIIRRGAKLIYAYAEATVPKVTVITRKAYGGAYDVMGSKHLGADMNFAWPTAQIAVMGAQGAVNILYRSELREAGQPDELRTQLVTEYEDHLANPYIAAERGYVDAVIPPSTTRGTVIKALRSLRAENARRCRPRSTGTSRCEPAPAADRTRRADRRGGGRGDRGGGRPVGLPAAGTVAPASFVDGPDGVVARSGDAGERPLACVRPPWLRICRCIMSILPESRQNRFRTDYRQQV